MDFDEYETLPIKRNYTSIHMVAGACAGIMEHCAMFPIDSVKTRMQILKPNPMASYRTVPEALVKMIRHEGVLRPVRGMTAVVLGAGPAHALHFSCYEKMKRVISGTEHGARNPAAQGLAGAISTLLHDAIMNPAEVVKQRMQVYSSPYKTCRECFSTILKNEGYRAFYRSYSTQLVMNIPFQSIHFMTYEFCQEHTNHERTYNPTAHMISGALSGAVASAVTNPLDTCKTLLNTQEQQVLHITSQRQIKGMLMAAKTIYKVSGLLGFFRGLQARMLFQLPATAISWSVYEFFKYTIALKYQHLHHNYKQEHSSIVAHAGSVDKQETASPSVVGISIVFNEKLSR